jgi:hypothetical protein
MSTFGSDGFTTTTDGSVGNLLNYSTDNYVTWAWKANGAGVSNTAGTISSTVSANTTSGFSVVTYTGNGSSSATVGHGLGVTPSMVVVKSRSNATSWHVWHTSLSSGYNLILNSTAAQEANSSTSNGGAGTPTSSVITFQSGTLSADNVVGNSRTFVAYCFAPIPQYSAAFSYTGNGSSDGSFVYVGFRPKFVIFKRTDSTGEWGMWDTSRNTYNASTSRLSAQSSAAELNQAATTIDILSNGFKFRTADSDINASGGTYIGMAFAESPFKFALAR